MHALECKKSQNEGKEQKKKKKYSKEGKKAACKEALSKIFEK